MRPDAPGPPDDPAADDRVPDDPVSDDAAPDDPAPDGAAWRRLDRRTVVASAVLALGACVAGAVPTVGGMRRGDTFSFEVAVALALGGTVLVVGLAAVLELVRLARTRFRVGVERVELHTGIVVRSRKGLARDRVRSVEVTADPVLRVLGLAAVRIGTGQRPTTTERPLELRALRRPAAEALRRELLAPPPPEGSTRATGPAPRGERILARLDLRWVGYAPVSLVTPALGIAATGAVFQASDWLGLQRTVLDETVAGAVALGVAVSALVAVAVVVVVGTVASAAVFVESWWGYRLTRESREAAGTLHVRRGLFTRRSTTLEEQRLRGVAVIEPLGARLLRAARVDAIATGLSHAEKQRADPRGLVPVAPRAVVDRVVADVLRVPAAPTDPAGLRPHPRAARRRRVVRGTAGGLVPAAALGALAAATGSSVPALGAAVVGVVGIVVGVWLGRRSYRALGHGLVGDHVVSRHGVLGRRTVALRRDGILTWAVSQTPFQRRVGLATLWFTTAAGDGRYGVYDLAVPEAAGFAAETLGDQVVPFLS